MSKKEKLHQTETEVRGKNQKLQPRVNQSPKPKPCQTLRVLGTRKTTARSPSPGSRVQGWLAAFSG